MLGGEVLDIAAAVGEAAVLRHPRAGSTEHYNRRRDGRISTNHRAIDRSESPAIQ